MTDQTAPAVTRDCTECATVDGMKLQNVVGTIPRNVPLLYICQKCGTMMSIPPPGSPLEHVERR